MQRSGTETIRTKILPSKPKRGGSNELLQSVFRTKIRKNVYPVKPNCSIKTGERRSTLHGHVSMMEK